MNRRPKPYRSGYRIPSNPSGKYHTIVKLRYPDKTIWQALKDFINDLKIDEEFTRKKVIDYIYLSDVYYSEVTIDSYGNQLTYIGILKWSKSGTYIKLKNIPEKLTTSKLSKLANKSSWQSWFTPIEMLDELL